MINSKRLVRGLRNNNPFNIKKSRHNWIGKIKEGTDPTFEQFVSLRLGVRAGLKLLCTYVSRDINTVSAIIGRFAPACENFTSYYVTYVCGISDTTSHFTPDTVIDSVDKLCIIASRIIRYECCLSTYESECLGLLASDLTKIFYSYNLKFKNNEQDS